MNRQQLLSRIGAHVDVTYASRYLQIRDAFGKAWWEAPLRTRFESCDNVWLVRPSRFILKSHRFPVIDRRSARRLARDIEAFMNARPGGGLTTYSFGVQGAETALMIDADHRVYHAYDRFDATPDWNDALSATEQRLLDAADLILASSDAIREHLSARTPKQIHVVPNGADTGRFEAAATLGRTPPELQGIRRPRIGYVGNINQKVDLALIAELAARHSEWSFVIVGGIVRLEAHMRDSHARCQALHNVHFVGPRPVTEIPEYVGAMDVNMMCYAIDQPIWAKSGYPLKMHEYLAAGRPVVSADLPAVRPFASVLQIARSVDEWEHAIAMAIEGNGTGSVELRRETARGFDWNLIASDLLDKLKALESGSA